MGDRSIGKLKNKETNNAQNTDAQTNNQEEDIDDENDKETTTDDDIPPEEFLDAVTNLGGDLCSMKLVIKRQITCNDIDPYNGRFSIYGGKFSRTFLNLDEYKHFHEGGSPGGFLRVKFIEPCLKVTQLSLKPERGRYYMFTDGWNAVSLNDDNELVEGARVHLWAFRLIADGSLGFALIVRSKPFLNRAQDSVTRKRKRKKDPDGGFNPSHAAPGSSSSGVS